MRPGILGSPPRNKLLAEELPSRSTQLSQGAAGRASSQPPMAVGMPVCQRCTAVAPKSSKYRFTAAVGGGRMRTDRAVTKGVLSRTQVHPRLRGQSAG